MRHPRWNKTNAWAQARRDVQTHGPKRDEPSKHKGQNETRVFSPKRPAVLSLLSPKSHPQTKALPKGARGALASGAGGRCLLFEGRRSRAAPGTTKPQVRPTPHPPRGTAPSLGGARRRRKREPPSRPVVHAPHHRPTPPLRTPRRAQSPSRKKGKPNPAKWENPIPQRQPSRQQEKDQPTRSDSLSKVSSNCAISWGAWDNNRSIPASFAMASSRVLSAPRV